MNPYATCTECAATVLESDLDFHKISHENIEEMQSTIDALVDLISKNAPDWLRGEK